MPSPFPGIDPYVEAQGHWRDFHTTFMTFSRGQLLSLLPPGYDARLEDRLDLAVDEDDTQQRYPDVDVTYDPVAAGGNGGALAVAEADPLTDTARRPLPFEPRQRFIEVTTLPEGELVTVIELLSPSNKRQPGFDIYVQRSLELLDGGANLVELDLLLAGRRPPLSKPLSSGAGYALVTLADRPDLTDIWAFGLRDRLPRIPIPLKPPDKPVVLDVGEAYRTTYDRGGFARRVRYDAEMPPEIAEADRSWLRQLLAESANRK